MSTFVLIPGAGGVAWYWHRVAPLLEEAGHTTIAVDLPGDDDAAGLAEYTEVVIDAIHGRTDVALVAQSLGGFTAPMVCEAAMPVESLTFVNAMIPLPDETPGDWWGNTGAIEAREAAAAAGEYGDFDPVTYFLHDVPAAIAAEGESHQRNEADAVFASPCEFESWSSLPVRAVAGSEDRFFPVEFQRRVAYDRLGIDIDVLPGGHLIALSQPNRLAEYLLHA